MQTTTIAEHAQQVAAIRAELLATARGLHLTEDQKTLVRFIADHSANGMQAMTSLLRRVV